MKRKVFRQKFPGKRVNHGPLWACDHCVNHYGIDVCGCGSGQPVGKCKNNYEHCRAKQPSQNIEEGIAGPPNYYAQRAIAAAASHCGCSERRPMTQVYVLLVHQGGDGAAFSRLFTGKPKAMEYLARWCKDTWFAQGMPEDDLPENDEEVIKAYFEFWFEEGYEWSLEQQSLDPDFDTDPKWRS